MPLSLIHILPEPAANSRPSWFGFLISVKPESGLDRNAVTRYIEDCLLYTSRCV